MTPDPIEKVLREIESRHVKDHSEDNGDYCTFEARLWPCDASLLIAALRALRAAMKATVEHVTANDPDKTALHRCRTPRTCVKEAMEGDGLTFEGEPTGWDAAILRALEGK